ncbi:MAG TPA: hypothetical protein VGX45_03145 [Solirubrobacteraceae bacterium]|nr:hypothetical protein [Solirubrobacteraceae bacterium]
MRRATFLIATAAACAAVAAPVALSAASPTRKLSDTSLHQTVHVSKGTELVVTLHSTYWTFNAPGGRVLTALGSPQVSPAPIGMCVPGQGCGTVTERYRAVKDGTGTINASRTTCGEALLCAPSQRTYAVRVVVAH